MSIYDVVQFVSQHPFDTFLFGGVSGLLLIFVCVGIYESKKIKQNKQTEIEKARKFYGDLTYPVFIKDDKVSNPPTPTRSYNMFTLIINGEEFTQSFGFDRFDKVPKKGEWWRVVLEGCDLKFIEKTSKDTASNVRFFGNHFDSKVDFTFPATDGIMLSSLPPIEEKVPPLATNEFIIHKNIETKPKEIQGNVTVDMKGVEALDAIDSIQQTVSNAVNNIKSFEIDGNPTEPGFYWVKSLDKWYVGWFSDDKDFYVANLGSDIKFRDRYYQSRDLTHWYPIHLPGFVIRDNKIQTA